MQRERGGLRPLVPALLTALALIAFSAPTAHATGEWKIEGKTLTELGKTKETVTATASESFKLAIPWYASEISCSLFHSEAGTILSGGEGHATFNLSLCTLSGPPFVSETCKLTEPIAVKAKVLLTYHNADGRTYERFEPAESGKPFTTIQFKEGTECPLPLKNEISGSFVGEPPEGEVSERVLSFNSSLEGLLASSLTFGSKPAALKGKAVLNLSGELKGKKWTGEVSQPSKEWKIDGKTLTELELKKEAVFGAASTAFTLTDQWFVGLEVSCETLTLEGAIFQGGQGQVAGLLESCGIFIEGNPVETCEVEEPVNLKLATSKLLSHGKVTYHLLSPLVGTTLFTVGFKPIEEGPCYLGEFFEYQGSIVGETENGERINQPLTFSSAISSLFPSDALNLGISPAALEGKASLSLSGASKGKPWTGIG